MEFGVMDNEQQRQLEKDVMSRYSNVEIQTGWAHLRQGSAGTGYAGPCHFLYRNGNCGISALSDSCPFLCSDTFCIFGYCNCSLAFMRVAGIELSLGTLAALLMLIGYSVDSDILLTNRIIKRRGTVEEKVSRAMHTGLP